MKTTTKLAFGNLKSGKTRSVLTGVAILLTTALITVILLGSAALARNQKENAAESYGEHYGMFSRLSPEQAEKIKLHSQFYNIGSETYAAACICKGYTQNLFDMDLVMRLLAHFNIESGSYPDKENEILAQKEFFEVNGCQDPKIGDTVTLSIRINGAGEIIKKDFRISGFLPSSRANDLAKRYSAYVSDAFLEANLPDVSKRLTYLGFQVANEENLNASAMKRKILSLAEELGIKENQVSINDNYLGWTLEPDKETVFASACILLVVMLVSMLVIYNIFHVSLIQKIREYGRLGALGASKRQRRAVVRAEGLLLSLMAVPAGIAIGALIVKIWLKGFLGITVSVFSVPLALAAAVLALFTVLLSMRKPMQTASKISPVEAMRYEAGGKELSRKGKENITLFGLTLSNLALQKKRTITTILTMGLSCILFVVIANIAGNMNADRQTREDLEYGRFRFELDAAMQDKEYPENNMNQVQKTAPFGKDFIESVKAIPGVTEVRTRKAMAFREKNNKSGENGYITVSVVNEEEFAWLVRNAERGVVDYQNTAKQDGVIYMWDHFLDDEYGIGMQIEGEILDGDRSVPFSAPILGSCGHSNDAELTITEATFEKLGIQEDMTSVVFIDCEKDAEDSVRKELETIAGNREHISLSCYEDLLRLTDMGISFTKGACYTFLAILGVIGFMNMANTLITNILTRKREFGIMQAVGMSSRQLNRMLQLEGWIFTAGTLALSLTLGNVLGYRAFLLCRQEGVVGLFEYRPPFLELGLMVAAVAVLQVMLAWALSKNVKKESLVERIRCE